MNIFFHFFPDKELLTIKERQDIELANARSTILDQKQQIDILRTMQSNVRLEEEVNKQFYENICIEIYEKLTRKYVHIKAMQEEIDKKMCTLKLTRN